jgi:Flp pilus assembly protein TadG
MRGRLDLMRDARGVAAVEFAMIAPLLLLLLYFGVVELTRRQ